MVVISGCMITKNEAEYVKQSIESIIDYVDELIVVDDCSDDGTQDIVLSFGEKVTLIVDEFNGDKKAQRQRYMDYARGKWIFCPDGDEVYLKKDMEWLRSFAESDTDKICVRTNFHHFWKDYIHEIRGHHWEQYLQRFFRNIEGCGYYDLHHSISLKPGVLMSSYASEHGLTEFNKDFYVFHYSYCKSAKNIRRKIEYYMRRDNPNCKTESDVDDFVNKHPYFSGDFHHNRYGTGGLYVAGTVGDQIDRIISFDGEHPEVMKNHPKYKLYHDYAINMNKYMEEHWQFHNHLHYPHHQQRLEHTASFCEGDTVEIGCANGDSVAYYSKFNPRASFMGVEPTYWGYNKAKGLHPDFKFFHAFAENLPFEDNRLDTVLLSEMIEHVADVKPVLDEAFRVAYRKVVITTPAKEHPDPDHKRVITPDDMRALLAPYAKEVKISGLTFEGWQKPVKLAEKEEDIHFMIVEAIL